MIINLKEIPVIFICPDHNEKYNKRKIHMNQLLIKLKFNNIIHYKSGNERYPKCLVEATIDIFNKYEPPFILLEDDVDTYLNYIPDELELPNNADAYYLGLSNGAGDLVKNCDNGESKFIYINNNIIKVENMLATHAIMYITKKYMNNVISIFNQFPNYYNDVAISKIQNLHNVYSCKYPFFYQTKLLEGQEEATNITIPSSRIKNKFTLTFVTAFLNIKNLSNEELYTNYFSYFEKLVKTGIPIGLFMDKKYKEYTDALCIKYNNLKIIRYITKDDLHINQINKINTINVRLPKIRSETKDTEEYIKLMNNKIYFVEEAMKKMIFDHVNYAWIDFRIFHIFKNEDLVNNKLLELSQYDYNNKRNISYFPGSWENITDMVERINWRFLGGFFIIDVNNIKKLAHETTSLLKSNIDVLSWETNYWSLIEFYKLFNFGWYKADHDETILNIPIS